MRLRTRAEINQEPRTVGFETTGPCTVSGEGKTVPIGLELEIRWPHYAEVAGYARYCGGLHYILTEKSVNDLLNHGAKLLHDIGRTIVICEHMGRIIE